MDNTIHNTGDDAVTIPEALKRLAKQNIKPARQSFYTAVNNGRIREVSDKQTNPNTQRIVSWASVQTYVSTGGFKSCHKREGSKIRESKCSVSAAEQSVENPPGDEVSANAREIEPAAVNPLPIGQAVSQLNSALGSNLKNSRRSQSPAQRAAKKASAFKQAHGNARSARKHPRLRTIKNSLRTLDYEQTKAIRDWADNRLLTVLRPASSVASNVSETKNPKPA